MIVVQIHSGLGNQLFMYAAARALARRHNTALYLDVDTDCREGRNFGEYVGHSFQLDRFNIKADVLGMSAIKEDGPGSGVGIYSTLKARLRQITILRSAVRLLRYRGVDLSKVALRLSGTDKRMFTEERGDWKYKPNFFELPDETILRGCFLSYRYFDSMRDVILDELKLKVPLSAQSKAMEHKILATESVSLHVRRGDVVSVPEYRSWYDGVLTERYYRNAISFFEQKLSQPHFFVFSDDIDWVKHNLPVHGKVTYVDHNGPERGYEDLHLMSRCKYNVTAGFSSFSWWAAYLNTHLEKIVVRTRRMNALDHLNHPEDFFPEGWVIVES
ncbi:MAG TPA: alpha-1,2-fucosyltransferase [Noviherbaspirillum sp.]|uniref:alpha-1,2-fucosyltransferase n=1 Tax=Noviherbaspirillum sp. TaxID=1926288 RepID=UPI002B490860|nr:alpha-1,2-fucosyltransferase [Noviherbaspirillum sp.]HJV86239.1 alpha-1,2-fucosyltransferase [Noviherbaspirillum sp.]